MNLIMKILKEEPGLTLTEFEKTISKFSKLTLSPAEIREAFVVHCWFLSRWRSGKINRKIRGSLVCRIISDDLGEYVGINGFRAALDYWKIPYEQISGSEDIYIAMSSKEICKDKKERDHLDKLKNDPVYRYRQEEKLEREKRELLKLAKRQ